MSDKRTVSTDALETLGTIIDEKQRRDAIHLAVEPVVAGEKLYAGDHVTVAGGVAKRTAVGRGLGIVDPFLESPVQAGQRFWFVMYPRKVTSLRHVWSHPAFPDEPIAVHAPPPASDFRSLQRTVSEKWILNYAQDLGMSYRTLMDGAKEYLEHGDTLPLPDERQDNTDPKFWAHYEAITDVKVNRDGENFFSCSC